MLLLTSPTIPPDAATFKRVRTFLAADPGTVLQHVRLRKGVGANIVSILKAF